VAALSAVDCAAAAAAAAAAMSPERWEMRAWRGPREPKRQEAMKKRAMV
jgi:hypothetical protein